MIKGKLVTLKQEAVELQCHRCGFFWAFKGASRSRANCPRCGTTNLFTIENKESVEEIKLC
jgi:Zn finger protein HypA/HybF involved in hydrogenase expression